MRARSRPTRSCARRCCASAASSRPFRARRRRAPSPRWPGGWPARRRRCHRADLRGGGPWRSLTRNTAPDYQKQARPTPEALVRAHMPLGPQDRLACPWPRRHRAIDVEDLAQIGMVALVEVGQQLRGSRPRLRDLRDDAHPRRDDRSSAPPRHASAAPRWRAAASSARSASGSKSRLGRAAERSRDGRGNGHGRRRLSRDGRRQPGRAPGIDRRNLFGPIMWFADVEERADEALDRERLKARDRRGDIASFPSARRWSCSSISSRR